MKVRFAFLLLLALFNLPAFAKVENGGEYYIVSEYYNMVLGDDGSGNPRLSVYDSSKDNSYRFVVSQSGSYLYLCQVSSKKYLSASTSNTWSVLLSDKPTGWKLEEGFGKAIVSEKNTSARLGCDFSDDNFVPVYYDKAQNSRARFSVIRALDGGYEVSLKAAETDMFTNAQGVQEKDDYCVTSAVTLNSRLDYHIISDTPFDGGEINITDNDAWVIFENVKPSKVISSYLSKIKINGKKASNGTNCRVAIFLGGAAVIPCKESDTPFVSDCISLKVGNTKNLGDKSNLMRSFTLKRGYMATLASGTNGSGYSRVWVADHSDLEITLPKSLDRRVSSVFVRKWNYISKKGMAGGTSAQHEKLGVTWTYNWNCDQWTGNDVEYIPIKQHIYWPSWSDINARTASTAVLGYNEPEHSEQHSDDCGTTISAWTACTHAKEFQESGMRIGSGSPTDASWLKEYIGHIDDMAYRCDFVAYHCYWGTSEANGASGWYSRLKSVYDSTKRPIWITEWEIGASWITSYLPSSYTEYRDKMIEVVDMLERTPFIERYSYYNTDTGGKNGYMRPLFYDDGYWTPAGRAYQKIVSTFAYNADYQPVPNWWAPSAQTPEVSGKVKDGKYVLTVKNPNGDATASIDIDRKNTDGTWTVVLSDTDRPTFDTTTRTYTVDIDENEESVFRVTVTTLYGGVASSDEQSSALINNPTIVTTDKENVPGWTCKRNAANGFTKSTGDTYFEVWGPTATAMDFDYYQDITDLKEGVYSLSAVCFNSTNGEENAWINGHVGLYAEADGAEYFAGVTDDSEIDYGKTTVIDRIAVSGGTLRIGVRNIGRMTARWAGADNFSLKYLGPFDDALPEGYDTFINNVKTEQDSLYRSLIEDDDASQLIVNNMCRRGTNYGWTTENLSYNKGEAYDGDAQNMYWDKYTQNLASSMSQTLHYVPAGKYTVSAMLRGSSTVEITLCAAITSTSSDGLMSHHQTINGIGSSTQAGSPYLNGWMKVELDELEVNTADTLAITISAKGPSAYSWWSVDDVMLTYVGEATTVISPLSSNLSALTSPTTFNLAGQQVDAAYKGIVIRNGKKLLVK